MKAAHLTDAELQQYLFSRSTIDLEIMEHLEHCPNCAIKAANYRLIASQIVVQDKPIFDFDLSALVMEQIAPVPVIKHSFLDKTFYWMIAPATLLFALLIYINKGAFSGSWDFVSEYFLYLIAIPVLAIFVFQFSELVRKHQKQMNLLNALS